jgi:hypothetical protein
VVILGTLSERIGLKFVLLEGIEKDYGVESHGARIEAIAFVAPDRG